MQSRLISYYEGQGSDHHGRTLEQILAWDDATLEHTHDYIQWLFPLKESSAFNPWAPVLNDDEVRAFWESEFLRGQLGRSFARMWSFYGFDAPRPRTWVAPGNHNFLRLTRILASTRLLGCEDCTARLFAALERVYRDHARVIGEVTYRFWRNAATGTRPSS